MLCLALVSACAATERDAKTGDADKSEVETAAKAEAGDEEPPPPVSAKIAISSVQMIQDCPDPPAPSPGAPSPGAPSPGAPSPQAPAPTEPLADESMAKPAAMPPRVDEGSGARFAPGDAPGFVQPCDQSNMQLTIEIAGASGQTAVPVAVKAVRLLSKGRQVGELKSRKPSAWSEERYQPWDEQLSPGEALKASYKLGLPDWTAVEQAIGESSFGHMFTIEVDVEVDGRVETVVSPEFPREEPHVIVT
ncbi:hypothetical protein [Enhygromyxa salina]|uniref:hypothetical protein n=1 Tax=Enhygromyxa salina TaxID=215803 RepID=UPI000D08FD1E|nr:hypothetical protein [Enhygromyxa salina]